jgi:hypothetical protein
VVEPADASSGAPVPIAEYDWIYAVVGDTAGLTYGLAESDDVWLELECAQGTGTVHLLQPVHDEHPRTISLESGGDTETYEAGAEPSELHEGFFLVADAKTSDPVFQRFRRLGWLAMYGPDYRMPMVPHPESAYRVEAFFAFCG